MGAGVGGSGGAQAAVPPPPLTVPLYQALSQANAPPPPPGPVQSSRRPVVRSAQEKPPTGHAQARHTTLCVVHTSTARGTPQPCVVLDTRAHRGRPRGNTSNCRVIARYLRGWGPPVLSVCVPPPPAGLVANELHIEDAMN